MAERLPPAHAPILTERVRSVGPPLLFVAVFVHLVAATLYAIAPGSLVQRVATSMFFVAFAGIGLSMVFGVPALFIGVSGVLKRDRERGKFLVIFFGPLLVFAGTELLPHLANPCSVSRLRDSPSLPSMCERITYASGFQGRGEIRTDVDVIDRWHVLTHSLAGAIPLTLVYAGLLRKLQIYKQNR